MKKKIFLNMASSLILEIVTLVCSFILPRLIMVSFGSEYNGIVTSVTQFLSFITLLRGGIGGVTRAALYKPLQEHDDVMISGILKATEKFMRRVSFIFVGFLVVFAATYPLLVEDQFGWFYTFSLVLVLGISTITQYYFGITYQMLIQADQRQYVYSALQIGATIVNTAITVVLIRVGLDFRMVKLGSALVFGAIPVVLYFYAHKKYNIIKNVPANDMALARRWDAFAHQVAAFIHSNTSVVILSIFSDLYQISIYTIYSMVTNGLKKFVNICSNGIDAAMGNLIARNATKTLKKGVEMYEWIIHVISTIFFVCAAMLIVPFIMVYTSGVTDTNYYQPALGYLLCLSQFIASIRIPYQNAVEAAGHFRETRNGAIVEAVMNVLVSIPCVIFWGCAGAVMGTVVAMTYRTIEYAIYASKRILQRSQLVFIKRFLISALNIFILMFVYFNFGLHTRVLKVNSYLDWGVAALWIFMLVGVVTVLMNVICYPNIIKQIFVTIFSSAKKQEKKGI